METKNDVKVYIASKGRPTTKTFSIFEEFGFQVVHVVEPQDVNIYKENNLKVVELPENNKGLSYARNFILQYAKQQPENRVIVCDDDVSSFGFIKNNRCVKSNKAIEYFYKIGSKFENAVVGMRYRNSAFYDKITDPLSINETSIGVCIMYNPHETSAVYDDEVSTKEDKDFMLQNFVNGKNIIRINSIFHSCPSIGTNKGGLYDVYREKRDSLEAKKMLLKWGDKYIKLYTKGGKIDCSVTFPKR